MPLELAVTVMLILRYDPEFTGIGTIEPRKESKRLNETWGGLLTAASNRRMVLLFTNGRHGWQDLAERPHAEKPFPAGIAAVRGEMQQPLGKQQETIVDALPGNVAQVKISASRAVGETRKRQRYPP
jgi:hypothetical protein